MVRRIAPAQEMLLNTICCWIMLLEYFDWIMRCTPGCHARVNDMTVLSRKPPDPLNMIRSEDPALYEWALSLRLNRLTQILDRQMGRLLAETVGIGNGEWRLLAALSRIGPVSFGGIVEVTLIDKALASRGLAALEAKNLVRKAPTAGDARSVTVELTTRGRRLVDRIKPLWRARQEHLLLGMTQAERITVYQAIDKLARRQEDFGKVGA